MIDAKIIDGDVATDCGARFCEISGTDALFQRAIVCMTVPRGSFIYDRELGAGMCAQNSAAKRELSFDEALAKYENTSVRVTGITGSAAEVLVTIDGESREMEVQSYGDV